jgi:hypothetical protein
MPGSVIVPDVSLRFGKVWSDRWATRVPAPVDQGSGESILGITVVDGRILAGCAGRLRTLTGRQQPLREN